MPCRHIKSPFLYLYKNTRVRFVESVSQGLSTLSQYFQVYYTISELELKDINSLCCIIIVDKKKVRKYLTMRKSIRYNVLFLVGPCEGL